MDWLFSHLQLLFVIGGAVAWWLKQHKEAKAGKEAAPPTAATFDDPELAERTRRIREEIQRKIEQRARGYTQPQPAVVPDEPVAPPPIPREVVVAPQSVPQVQRQTAKRREAQRDAEILEQQAALVEQLQQAAAMKLALERRTQPEGQLSITPEQNAAAVMRGALADDLRNPEALRRAFILREVLGPPVALR